MNASACDAWIDPPDTLIDRREQAGFGRIRPSIAGQLAPSSLSEQQGHVIPLHAPIREIAARRAV